MIYFQNPTDEIVKAMCEALYHVQVEHGTSKHFVYGVLSFLQLLFAFDLISKNAAQCCILELALHDIDVYDEIMKCQPLTDKIKFQQLFKGFDIYQTLRLQLADLKKEIKHLENVRNQTFCIIVWFIIP